MTSDVIHVWDAHAHYFSRKTMEQRAKKEGITLEEMENQFRERRIRLGLQDTRFELPPEDPVEMAKKWIAEMEKYAQDGISIDKMVFFSRDLESLSAMTNFSDRLIGFVFLDLEQDKDLTEVLKSATFKYGVKGIKMIPGDAHLHVFDEQLWPIYEFAEKHRLPIIMHSGLLIGGGDLRYLNPLEVQPIAREFPEANFILAHLGGGFVREVLFLFYQTDNVYVDTSSSNIWYKYLPYPGLSLKRVFRKYLDTGGPDRIFFGTDSGTFPRGFRNNLLQEQLGILRELGIAHEDIQKIMRDNLAGLLHG